MCKRIAASLACIALVFSASEALAEDAPVPLPYLPIHQPYLPAEEAQRTRHLPTPPPQPRAIAPIAPIAPNQQESRGPRVWRFEVSPNVYAETLVSDREFQRLMEDKEARDARGARTAIAPAASNCPGAFTIVTNGDSEILLDTRNGDSWLLAKSNDFDRWRKIKRDQKSDNEGRPGDLGLLKNDGDGTPEGKPTLVMQLDFFGFSTIVETPAQPDDPGIFDSKDDHIRALKESHNDSIKRSNKFLRSKELEIGELKTSNEEHAREAKEAKKQLAKAVDANESFIKRINQQEEEIAELRKKLGVPAPDGE